jgi:GDP-D-mannose dehydratase
LGDPSKISNSLGWKPQVSFGELVSEMVESDLSNA